jgi:hypothetical protein
MHRNSIYFCLYPKNLAQGMVESEVMDGVTAIEQSSVYVEQVSVG